MTALKKRSMAAGKVACFVIKWTLEMYARGRVAWTRSLSNSILQARIKDLLNDAQHPVQLRLPAQTPSPVPQNIEFCRPSWLHQKPRALLPPNASSCALIRTTITLTCRLLRSGSVFVGTPNLAHRTSGPTITTCILEEIMQVASTLS